MSSLLECTQLGKRFGRRWALHDLSMSVPEGRIVALVGPNGAGKTTLLQLAVGLTRPTAGELRVLGMSPHRDTASFLSRVGHVAQHPALFRRFSVRDLLHMGANLNPRWDQDLATGRLRQLEIGLDLSVGALSGGMRAQVALVLALAKRPQLLLLDEPVASLDPLARHEFLRLLMDAAAADGLSVVLSSHVIGDLSATCDHLVVLARGETQLTGAMDETVAAHRRLVGPAALLPSIAARHDVIAVDCDGRQASLVARLRGPLFDSRWEAHPIDLEEVVRAYLRRRSPATAVAPPAVAVLTS